MIDFTFQNTTKIIFGKDALSKLEGEVLAYSKRILLVTGGGSVKRSGLYDQVMAILNGIGAFVVELTGIKPNPRLDKVTEGVEICRREDIGLVLALGGGSVIDTAKGIANGALYEGSAWDFYSGKYKPTKVLPLGCILTIAAAGSEMSVSSVITNEATLEKRGFNSMTNQPKFSLLNPEWTYTLPAYQTACGCVDIMAHMMERYFTQVENVELTDRMIAGCIKTMLHNTPLAIEQPYNYAARAEFMWTGTIAHNALLETGRIGDWASHMLEHELSASYDIAHGAGLAIIFPAWMKTALKLYPKKIAQFAVDVFDVPANFGTETEIALEGVRLLENFYRSIGMPVRMSEAGIADPEIDVFIARGLPKEDSTTGNYFKIGRKEMREIYELAR